MWMCTATRCWNQNGENVDAGLAEGVDRPSRLFLHPVIAEASASEPRLVAASGQRHLAAEEVPWDQRVVFVCSWVADLRQGDLALDGPYPFPCRFAHAQADEASWNLAWAVRCHTGADLAADVGMQASPRARDTIAWDDTHSACSDIRDTSSVRAFCFAV